MYNEEFASSPVAPSYQPFKCGDGYSVMICKSKSARNPLYKWTFGTENYAINEICFSPCGQNLAIVSQDGFLRVFQYNTMELIGVARSYFGGFLCVCWSPDGKYLVVGGEDDLVTVFSLLDKRVVARGQGHRSWVSVVAFDPYTTSYTNWEGPDFSDDENPVNENYNRCHTNHNSHDHAEKDRNKKTNSSVRDSLAPDKLATSYRLGSVGQDTQLCLWDITDDVLRQSIGHRTRLSSYEPINTAGTTTTMMTTAINGIDGTNEIPIIKPVAISSIGSSINSNATNNTNNKDQVDACASTKTTSKFLSNCTNVDIISDTNLLGSSNKTNSLVSNCIGNSVASKDTGHDKSASSTLSSKHSSSAITVESTNITATPTGNTPTSTGSNSNNLSNHHHHTSAFNTLTQKLSNFSFGSDKNNSGTGKIKCSVVNYKKNTNFLILL